MRFWLTLFLFCTATTSLLAHASDEANISFTFKDETKGKLSCEAILSQATVRNYTRIVKYTPNAPKGSLVIDKKALTSFLKGNFELKVDGITVPPVLDGCMLKNDLNNRQLLVYMHYPMPVVPKTIELTALQSELLENMTSFNNSAAMRELNEIYGTSILDDNLQPAEISCRFFVGAKVQTFMLTEQERGFTWHAPRELVKKPVAQVQPDPINPQTAYLLIAGIGISVLIILTVTGKPHGKSRKAVLTLLFLSSVSSGVYGLAGKSQRLPETQHALDIFTKLHANIYRSFEYRNESDIYDSLSQSVNGPILDTIYQDIYSGLVLADEGGAVCSIDKVDVLSKQFVKPQKATKELSFQVKCNWKVHGLVTHWGHDHKRINQYEALYTVTSVDNEWKITDSQLTSQKRVDK